MSGKLPKLSMTSGAAMVLIGLSAVGLQGTGSRAEDYPEWDETVTYATKNCTSTAVCQSCESEGGATPVYGAIPTAPDEGYHQGNCMFPMGKSANGCTGTKYTCLKRICQYGTPVGGGANFYNGNWCK